MLTRIDDSPDLADRHAPAQGQLVVVVAGELVADAAVALFKLQFFDGGNFISNGSLIGYNAFAVKIGASYEPPRQAFCLIDSKRGKTGVFPIFVED